VRPLRIPFEFARNSWTIVLDGGSGRCEVLREGELVGVTRYDPDLGFGQASPTLQPLLTTMHDALLPFDEKIRFVQKA
jgi:hypothetical protein